jgi:hypothetical protein
MKNDFFPSSIYVKEKASQKIMVVVEVNPKKFFNKIEDDFLCFFDHPRMFKCSPKKRRVMNS